LNNIAEYNKGKELGLTEQDLCLFCFDNISDFVKLNFLMNVNGKTVIDLPVITMNDRRRIFDLSDMCSTVISGRFHDDFMKLMKNKLEVPKHLKSVPEWQKYMNCCSTFTMRVILKAKQRGLFLKEYNREDYPVPAMVLVIEK